MLRNSIIQKLIFFIFSSSPSGYRSAHVLLFGDGFLNFGEYGFGWCHKFNITVTGITILLLFSVLISFRVVNTAFRQLELHNARGIMDEFHVAIFVLLHTFVQIYN